ncbi:hypothetical protein DY000_02053112 [Brassica cretica]|uniref:Uncharacterized protein n=1 Tax=Brassica cretica TaxID=69181 RepID=A0ABQ7A5Q6_BRACR|nr:hypothetical protein DY000_02053112 [Brassica cretica]
MRLIFLKSLCEKTFPGDLRTLTKQLRPDLECTNNLQKRMHVIGVDKEILKNHWIRGDEAIRSFVGTWFQMSKEDVNTCFPTSSHSPLY